ncbi:RnfABCDGE type electron transport complex subunit D [Butyrivibrio sp. MC2013]|uniref:RnfABCDGE type electron transport complex subunit D n=1 Tax=Butyrivibrio sp. MC2013 TaxID=1280686 RepID=UPI00041289AD|nr:RnfABCDGE type electron transport complex subunit D [Butyrivibrio sp. MC2013]
MAELRNVSSNPHVRAADTTKSIMLWVIMGLCVPAAFGVYNFGLRALIIMILSIVSCVCSEAVYEKLMHQKITVSDLSAVVTGLLLGMNMPATIPYWVPVMGGIFAIVVVKMLFGGLGQNFMNPALGARCFLVISFPKLMTAYATDTYSGATPLAALKAGESVNVMDMIIGRTGGVIGETSMIAIVLGACIMILAGVIDLRIPGSYIVTFAIMTVLIGGKGFYPPYLSAQLAGGGLMLGAFFMATDYVSSPITPKGKYIFGIILGLLTAIFRFAGSGVEGVSYAIIIGNLMVPLIERWTLPRAFGISRKSKKEGAA